MSAQHQLSSIELKVHKIKEALAEIAIKKLDYELSNASHCLHSDLQSEIDRLKAKLSQSIIDLESSKEREARLNRLVCSLYQRLNMKESIS